MADLTPGFCIHFIIYFQSDDTISYRYNASFVLTS